MCQRQIRNIQHIQGFIHRSQPHGGQWPEFLVVVVVARLVVVVTGRVVVVAGRVVVVAGRVVVVAGRVVVVVGPAVVVVAGRVVVVVGAAVVVVAGRVVVVVGAAVVVVAGRVVVVVGAAVVVVAGRVVVVVVGAAVVVVVAAPMIGVVFSVEPSPVHSAATVKPSAVTLAVTAVGAFQVMVWPAVPDLTAALMLNAGSTAWAMSTGPVSVTVTDEAPAE